MFSPLYYLYVVTKFNAHDLVDVEESDLKLFDADGDKIIENVNVTNTEKLLRFALSYVLFGMSLLMACGVTIGFTILQNFTTLYTSADTNFATNSIYITLISLAISSVISVVNFLWKTVCTKLTNFEKHKTWSGYRTHNTFKRLFFKLINVFVMGFTKGFFNVPCVVRTLGNQYLIQMLLEFFVFNGTELIVPYCKTTLKSFFNKGGDEDIKPEFDISDEYLEVVYRQYIVYCGMASFPMITLLASIASVFELYLDKWRLLKVCQKPPVINGSAKSVVTFFLVVISILPLMNWGGGSLYTLIGIFWCNTTNNLECEPCKVFGAGETFIPNIIGSLY